MHTYIHQGGEQKQQQTYTGTALFTTATAATAAAAASKMRGRGYKWPLKPLVYMARNLNELVVDVPFTPSRRGMKSHGVENGMHPCECYHSSPSLLSL